VRACAWKRWSWSGWGGGGRVATAARRRQPLSGAPRARRLQGIRFDKAAKAPANRNVLKSRQTRPSDLTLWRCLAFKGFANNKEADGRGSERSALNSGYKRSGAG
jgi:hypothetical protein